MNFEKEFQEIRGGIEREMLLIRSQPPSQSEAGQILDNLQLQVEKLQTFFNQNHVSLPSYEVQRFQSLIDAMNEDIHQMREAFIPRKKFSFKKARKTSQQQKSAKPSTSTPTTPPEQQTTTTVTTEKPTTTTIQNVNIYLSLSSITDPVTLQSIANSIIVIPDVVSSLYLRNLDHCTIVAAPVSSSVLIQNCNHCTFIIGGQQARLHSLKECEIYLLVKGKPILEECSEISVAPYSLETNSHLSKESLLQLPKPESPENCWNKINDIEWLRDTQSPHWKELLCSRRRKFRLEQEGDEKKSLVIVGAEEEGSETNVPLKVYSLGEMENLR